ncbi:hypothetical protein [Pyxidicoccus xibeiensis]|uniref:hypothetical protein n=1 Tax=Pyxidicoccus xibeiensis TaxID=2906759 RepID=UPI0020A821AC|nr:hypothetical protein [Pyxidicoccus xibeiensis]MCP3138843.1 hypothetical protein [Pyxidicoccus xibeiensis]
MKLGFSAALAALTLGLTGCDESMCSGMESAYEDYQAHVRDCGGTTQNLSPTRDTDVCNDHIDDVCTDDDEAVMFDYMDCLRDLPGCGAGVDAIKAAARQCSDTASRKINSNNADCHLTFAGFTVDD